MVEKMTAFWLIILTIITCASIPVFMVILTSPQPTQFIIVTGEKIIDSEQYKDKMNFLFIPKLMV